MKGRKDWVFYKRAALLGVLVLGLAAGGVGLASFYERGWAPPPGAATLTLVDERGEAIWTSTSGGAPGPEALARASRVAGYDPRGVKVFDRPVVRVNGEPMVDMGWGLVRLKELIARSGAPAPRPPAYGEYGYPYYYDDDWYEHVYKYGAGYEHPYPYYYDDYYEYRYKYGYPHEAYEYRYPYDD